MEGHGVFRNSFDPNIIICDKYEGNMSKSKKKSKKSKEIPKKK